MSGPEAFDANPRFEGIDGFDDVIGLLREGPIDLTDEQPSPSVWAGIAEELGLEEATDSSATLRLHAVDGDLDPSSTATPSLVPDSNVVSMADRRPRWGRPASILTLAAAVALLLAVPVGLSLRDDSSSQLVASADLELLEGQVGEAVSAQLVSIDGDLVLEVGTPAIVGDGQFLELWLLEISDDGVQSLESLGRVDESGRYDVPDDIDLDRFDVVDISLEIDDGNPDHSGISVVRGDLA
jgi:hypothetical protein